jgi:hypothetical protein
MSSIPEHILKEAAERGLVDGAQAISAHGRPFIVVTANWLWGYTGLAQITSNDRRMDVILYGAESKLWATPIKEEQKPEPSMPLSDVEKMVREIIESDMIVTTDQENFIRSIAKKYGAEIM